VYLTSVIRVETNKPKRKRDTSPKPIFLTFDFRFLMDRNAGIDNPRTIVENKTNTNIFGKLIGSSSLVQIANKHKSSVERSAERKDQRSIARVKLANVDWGHGF
jgi:hypothetical protein